MKISSYTGGMAQTNGYLVETPDGNFLVDAPEGISGWLDEKGVRIDALYLTHQHYDHVEDVALVRAKGAKVHAWAHYSKDLTLELLGAPWIPAVEPYQVDGLIPEGVGRYFGADDVRAAHVPGHSPDSVILYLPGAGVVFAGDALFAGSVGRCDLPGGSFELLLSGIRRELLTLPDETKVLPGHGGATTIGREKAGNGFLK
ncbi:MBL fold metallo-hydrolase [Akkermansiaceae bacterium]|nr:MBL fold metallo-hydrolase [Akkermansiaceae bacterium]